MGPCSVRILCRWSLDMEFLPFHEVRKHKQVLIVDSYFKDKTMFSHWRGAPKIAHLHDDTSTGIALNAIKAKHPACKYPFVSNNHFDIDGFLGIWSLLYPELAVKHESLLREAALIGDFREWNPKLPISDLALKLCCWINYREKKFFYKPFGEKLEAQACVEKYHYFLRIFGDFLNSPESYVEEFRKEYKTVLEGAEQIEATGYLKQLSDIHLQIVSAKEPLHYYALFQNSGSMDMVLSMYAKNRYELEYKYISWVDTESRMTYPRLDFEPLAVKLNERENSPFVWEYDSIMDTGPMLRLHKSELSKADRYGQPYEREIYSSSISPEAFVQIITDHYRACLQNMQARATWTWKEMRAFST